MQKESPYKTINYYLASFLISKGCHLEKVEPKNSSPTKVIFVFYNSKKLQKLVEVFYSPTPVVNPHDFANAQKYLKSIIYSNRS